MGKKLLPTRVCTKLVCKQRFIPAQSILWHNDAPQYSLYCGTMIHLQYSLYCGTMIHLSTVYTVAQWYSSVQSILWHNDTPQYSLYCGTMIHLSTVYTVAQWYSSIFQYRILWKFCYLNFPVPNFMKRYYFHFPVSNFMRIY